MFFVIPFDSRYYKYKMIKFYPFNFEFRPYYVLTPSLLCVVKSAVTIQPLNSPKRTVEVEFKKISHH